MTIISQTGVSTPFVFAATGDELRIAGIISNQIDTSLAVILSNEAGNTVTNAGLIASFGTGDAVTMVGGGTLTNSGGISGGVSATATLTFTNALTGRFAGFLINVAGDFATGSVITNRGTMTFADAPGTTVHTANSVIELGLGNDTVINSGKIIGDVRLGDGANVFDGRGGGILGTVYGGVGDDIYYLSSHTVISDSGGMDTVSARLSYMLANGLEMLTLAGFGNFNGTGNTADNVLTGNGSNNRLQGLGGNDTLLGGVGADMLDGGTNNDSLAGQTGADRLFGNYGNDTLDGGDGADVLSGDTGTDSLLGGLSADTLNGGVGADTLEGGDGNDVLNGGAFGKDIMTGGLGADVFAFVTANDSFATLAADVITDFELGIDKISLAELSTGTVLFLGSGPFTGLGPSVQVTLALGASVVAIDVDGNGTVDMRILLTGAPPLTETDFIL